MPCAVCFLSVGFINQWSRQSRNQMKDIHSGNTHTFYRTLHEPKPRLPWVVQVSWYHWSDKLVIGVRFNWRPYHYLVGGVTWWAWLQRDVTQCCPAPPNSAQTHETAEDTQQWSDVSVLQSDKFHFVFTDSRNKKRCILNRTGLLSGEVYHYLNWLAPSSARALLDRDISVSSESVRLLADQSLVHLNWFSGQTRKLLLVEDLVDSLKVRFPH